MFWNRRKEGWSLRTWAEKAGLAPSVVAATEAGSSWHAMADCLDLTLTLKAPAPLSSSTAKWVPHPPITAAELTIRTAAAQAGDSALRGRLAHDLICWQLAYARRALGVTIADLNRKGGISANTVTRVEHAPQTGEVVSYRVMLAMAYEVRMELLATWRHRTPRLVWQL
jgi:lambda repressor-like predicted transcriptional regulator